MNELERVIPEHLRPARRGGFVGRWDDDAFIVYSRLQACQLNASAAFVWLLSDGSLTVGEIVGRVKARHPEQAPRADQDVALALSSMRKQGLVRLSGAPRKRRPLLNVAFTNHSPGFPTSDNYLLWMLAHRFAPVLVDPATRMPDILFFSDGPAGCVDQSDVDEAASLKVFFSSGSLRQPPKGVDYAFLENSRGGPTDCPESRLPCWATRVNWGLDTSEEPAWIAELQRKRMNAREKASARDYFCILIEGGNAALCAAAVDAFERRFRAPLPIGLSAGSSEEARALSRSRFAMLFEDTECTGLAADRMLKILEAGTVPIYFGKREVVRDFNTDAYIDATRFNSMPELVDFVVGVDNDLEARTRLVAAPVFAEEVDVETFAPKHVCRIFYEALFQPEEEQPVPVVRERRSPRRADKPKLTIGMATYDDYDGVYFSVQAIRLFHREVTEITEILVVDNNPGGVCAAALKSLEDSVPGLRYVPYTDMRSTAVRDAVFREASADNVLCIDSHVFLEAGAIDRLIRYFDANPGSNDLLQGPLLYDNLEEALTHFDPIWSQGMYGQWVADERGLDPDAPPFEIPMQGLGVFACRKAAWAGFNPRFIGFGGEEGYIHEKFRQRGGRALCLPFLRWIHRFNRPFGVQYQNRWENRFRNYFLGFTELGLDTRPIVEHFAESVSVDFAERALADVREELQNPFTYFDAIYCINLVGATKRWEEACRQFEAMGIAHRVIRFDAVETPESHHIGCALSHRQIVEKARRHGYENVLVFEDDVVFLQQAREYLKKALEELQDRPWKLLYLGGHRWGKQFDIADGCAYLLHPTTLTCTHAIAYHHTAYDQILEGIPADMGEMREWLKRHRGIDQYFMSFDSRYLTSPSVATQLSILGQEDTAVREQYMVAG